MKTVSSTYIANEEARTRKPVELYYIYRDGGEEKWYYTSGDVPVTYSGNVYVPATIERDEISFNSDLNVTEVKIKAAFLTDPVIDFIAQNPVEMLWVVISKLHRSQSPLEAAILFTGQIKGVKFHGNLGEATVVGFEWYFRQEIPRYRFSPTCNNTLYDTYCGVVKATYTHVVTLSTISSDGLTLTSATFAGQADGYFTRGYISFSGAYRTITSHTGNTITISYKIIGLTGTSSITAYAGCDLTKETCLSKFNNINNMFAHLFIPTDNPATRA